MESMQEMANEMEIVVDVGCPNDCIVNNKPTTCSTLQDCLEPQRVEVESSLNEENQQQQGTSLPEDSEPDFKSDFEAFLDFSFPEDSGFSAVGDISDPFYFESDHVALKGNEDYRRLLRAFVKLESQRSAALHDLDELLKFQKKALSDPIGFSQELVNGTVKDKLPGPRRVTELPNVAWEKYTDDVESVLSSFSSSHHMTRQKQKRELMNGIRQCIDQSPTKAAIKLEPAIAENDEPRPAKFNQSWSVEEQRKLENLLKKYPPERFESRRWGKIAKELPGRTNQQVASRVQKYFIKLARAGLPVPGRMPNVTAYGGRLSVAGLHRHQRYNRFLHPTSTFMTSYEPPVYMSDDDDGSMDTELPLMDDTLLLATGENNDDEAISSCLRETPEYRQLQALVALQKDQQQLHLARDSASSTQCVDGAVRVKSEPEDGQCTARSGFVDPDYASSATGISNYLDPNYMPGL